MRLRKTEKMNSFEYEKNRSDELICVDIFDREIGTADKMACHVKPVLHRAFSVFIVDGNRMLIQRRAMGKYHSGGLWANACCSHPRAGESLSDAVERRLFEETGIRCETEELFSFVYCASLGRVYEYELDHVFLGEYGGNVTPDPDEIMDTWWIELDELATLLVSQPEMFSVWFITAAPKVLAYLKQR